GVVKALVAHQLPPFTRAPGALGSVEIGIADLPVRGIGTHEHRIAAATKNTVLEGVELFLAPILVMSAGDHDLVAEDQFRVAVDIEIRNAIDGKASATAERFQPAQKIDLVLEERGRRRPIEGDDRALRLGLARSWVEAVAAPRIVRLVGVRAEAQEDRGG